MNIGNPRCRNRCYGLLDVFYDLGGNTSHDGIVRYIFSNYRAGSDYSVLANGYAGEDRCVRAYPDILFQNDRGRVGSAPVFGGEAVVEGGKDHVMPDLATVVQCHPAMILK